MNNFTKGAMHRLLILVASFFLTSNAGPLRVPKIYNALISSDENLTASHAYPIIEPVYRTTALGVAFPPLIVHPSPPREFKNEGENKEEAASDTVQQAPSDGGNNPVEKKDEKPQQPIPELAYHGSLYPLAYDPYFPYAYTSDFLFPAFPYYQQPVFVDFTHFDGKQKEKEGVAPPARTSPTATAAANFKKNPEIPDVPPPPLPVKTEKKKD